MRRLRDFFAGPDGPGWEAYMYAYAGATGAFLLCGQWVAAGAAFVAYAFATWRFVR